MGTPYGTPRPAAPTVSSRARAAARGSCAGAAAGHGTAHMAAIGKASARTTIARHGVACFRGIVAAKGWAGPREPELVADLAGGRWLADLAA